MCCCLQGKCPTTPRVWETLSRQLLGAKGTAACGGRDCTQPTEVLYSGVVSAGSEIHHPSRSICCGGAQALIFSGRRRHALDQQRQPGERTGEPLWGSPPPCDERRCSRPWVFGPFLCRPSLCLGESSTPGAGSARSSPRSGLWRCSRLGPSSFWWASSKRSPLRSWPRRLPSGPRGHQRRPCRVEPRLLWRLRRCPAAIAIRTPLSSRR